MYTSLYSQFFAHFQTVLHAFPLLLVQAIALLGIITIALFFRDKRGLAQDDSNVLGIMLGVSSIILSFLTKEWGQYTGKFFLMTDCLFLAGFIGGWRNAVWAACLTMLGRLCFGEVVSVVITTFDTFFIALASAFLRYYLSCTQHKEKNIQWYAKLLFWRFSIVTIPIIIIYAVHPAIYETAQKLLIGRAIGSISFSALIVIVASVMIQQAKMRTQQMYIDRASQLPNRKAFQKDIEEKFSKNTQKPRSLLIIDINNMYDMIFELGHSWADLFSQHMGETLRALTKEPWLEKYSLSFYCYSERAFIIGLEGINTQEINDKEIASKIYHWLLSSETLWLGSTKAWLTVGVFDVLPEHIDNPTHLMRALALIHRSDLPIQYFQPNLMHQLNQEVQLRKNIEEWIQNKRVPLWLQPKVSLHSNDCLGAEALLRVWDDNNSATHISPPLVFSIAARYHLTEALEWATIETIVSYMNEVPLEQHSLVFSLNISSSMLTRFQFAKKLYILLLENNIAPQRLTLEVTETERLPERDMVVKENITEIQEAGIGLSLDDFGTGYASISLLSHFPFTELKLDYSMISNMDDSRVFAAITLSIETAKRYNATIVAEGVECTKQQQELKNIGVTVGQGYLFGKAMPLQDFIVYAKSNSKPSQQFAAPLQ